MTRDCGPLGREGEQMPAQEEASAGRLQRWSEEQVRSCSREQLSGQPSILTWWQWKYRTGRFT
ncbi:unnamed protein product, partial [Staurois parvus]